MTEDSTLWKNPLFDDWNKEFHRRLSGEDINHTRQQAKYMTLIDMKNKIMSEEFWDYRQISHHLAHGPIPKPPDCQQCQRMGKEDDRCPKHARTCICDPEHKFENQTSWKRHKKLGSTPQIPNFTSLFPLR